MISSLDPILARLEISARSEIGSDVLNISVSPWND